MKKKRVMIREKLIIGDKLKRYTFFTYYDITPCLAPCDPFVLLKKNKR